MEFSKKRTFSDESTLDNKYLFIKELGMGAYGSVSLYKDNNEALFAIKKFFFDKYKKSEYTVNNQLSLLNSLQNKENRFISKVIHHFNYDSNDYIATEYFPYSLLDIIKKLKELKISDKDDLVKTITYNLIEAFNFLHENNVTHRDIKPENIMFDYNYQIKLIDFDLARKIENSNDTMTKGVGTLYYKCPEILFGETNYGFNLDKWSLGCVLAELVLFEPLFKSENELDLLDKITSVLGVINEDSYPGVSKLSTYFEFEQPDVLKFDITFKNCSEEYKEIIKNLLSLNPCKRPNLKNLLSHKYFEDMNKFKSIKDYLFSFS